MADRGSDQRLVEQVLRISARAQHPLDLLRQVAAVIRPRIPYDAAGWLLVDPDTFLLTAVHAENVTREQQLALIECELTEDDVNTFADLARRGDQAASLSSATGGDLYRSARYRRVYAPHGFGDELRAVFRSAGTPWGHACLTRRASEPFFTRGEVELFALLCPYVGDGLRRCLDPLQDGAPGMHRAQAASALVVLADDGSVVSMSPRAAEVLGLVDGDQPDTAIVLHEVAQQARSLASADRSGPLAHARTRARDGGWVVVRGARLEGVAGGPGRNAVMIEPARRSEIAPLLLRLRRLTAREREVAQLLLAGLSTREISARLWIAPETLRGHIKVIFAKLDVSSRPELAALLLEDLPAVQGGAARSQR
ncbi:helix-turn-helix transcriptional regulator [Puerhibacterium sp. TATVAM-FAB25]|uniref:helix-turn-helix transcriptional regulator n=1 Tax=Puerhibacterium sp. TATVAM-FAB25 TaxID=3093699 RepID=UPI00397B08DF